MKGQESHTFWQVDLENTHSCLGKGAGPEDTVPDLHGPDVCTSCLWEPPPAVTARPSSLRPPLSSKPYAKVNLEETSFHRNWVKPAWLNKVYFCLRM